MAEEDDEMERKLRAAARRVVRVVWMVSPLVVLAVLAVPEWTRNGDATLSRVAGALSLGPNRPFQIVYGLLILLMARALWTDLKRRGVDYRWGPKLLFVLAGVVFVSACLAMDETTDSIATWSTARYAFTACGMATIILAPLALYTLYVAFARDSHWRGFAPITLVAAVLAVIAATLMILLLPSRTAHPGVTTVLLRRGHLSVFVCWYALAAAKLLRDTHPSNTASAVPAPTKAPINWEVLAAKIEVGTVPLAIVGGLIALLEYCDTHERDRIELAQRAYEKADSNWTEFLKLCAEHPEANCYSGAIVGSGGVTGAGSSVLSVDDAKKELVLTFLVDTFEVAYVNYNNESYVDAAEDDYCAQWPTWIVAMRKFLARPDFQDTWTRVHDEYDKRYQRCMKALIDDPAIAMPVDCRVLDCPAAPAPPSSN